MRITKPYSILFNTILDALPLIKQGSTEQAYDLLLKAQQQTEEFFIVKGGELREYTGNSATELGITKEYLHNAIHHQILNEDGLDGVIYEHLILDEYEGEPYFGLLCDVYHKVKHTYFKLGFDTSSILKKNQQMEWFKEHQKNLC